MGAKEDFDDGIAYLREMQTFFKDMTDYLTKQNQDQKKITISENEVYSSLEKWARLTKGNILGHYREFQKASKHQNRKERYVRTVGKFGKHKQRGDIRIFKGSEGLRKTVQIKSVRTYSSVKKTILDALNQLTGERKEKPAKGDRRVAQINLYGDAAYWPEKTDTYSGKSSQFIESVTNRLKDYLKNSEYRKGKKGWHSKYNLCICSATRKIEA
jgi:hypothetical protein